MNQDMLSAGYRRERDSVEARDVEMSTLMNLNQTDRPPIVAEGGHTPTQNDGNAEVQDKSANSFVYRQRLQPITVRRY